MLPNKSARSIILMFCRRFQLRLGELETLALAFDGPKETGFEALVTGGADLLDLDEQSVTVAVEGDVLDGLDMSAGFSLHPEFLAGAAPEMGLAGGDGGFERGAVHPGHHQHPSSGLLLDNGGNEAGLIIFQLIVKAHDIPTALHTNQAKY